MDELRQQITIQAIMLLSLYGVSEDKFIENQEAVRVFADQIISLFHGSKNYPNDYINKAFGKKVK